MDLVRGNHHLTFCVGPAQEDYDFHTKTLGLRSIKKTALYDGQVPVYHLYYGNAFGDGGTVLTSFPFRQQGVMGRRGTNQISSLNLSVPVESLGFWADRIAQAGIDSEEADRFGTPRLEFAHPCGIPYSLVADGEGDPARSWEKGGVSADQAILGTHGITVSLAYPDEMVDWLTDGVGAKHSSSDNGRERFQLGNSGRGRWIELVHEPDLPPATWRFGEGTVHHAAYDIGDSEAQLKLKGWLEGLGYTDTSDVKDRGYFMSIYTRTPSGALFEFAWSKPELWTLDEPADRLGGSMQIPPPFAHATEEMMAYLEPIQA